MFSVSGLRVLGIVSIVTLAGCASETQVPVFPVSGKINFKGKPPVGAQVVLRATGAGGVDGVVPIGTVKPDGSFTITSYEPDDGAPEGDYVALIRWNKLSADGTQGPNVLPRQYADAKASPVRVSVGNGPVDIPAINIK
jgi:hypothetical protein